MRCFLLSVSQILEMSDSVSRIVSPINEIKLKLFSHYIIYLELTKL
jgi:hypothetical protein